MLKALFSILLLILIFIGGEKWLNKGVIPCEKPIPYSIGSFDRRFNLSREKFLAVLTKAEMRWESALGRELFTYSPEDASLTINLVYDYRQEVTEELFTIEKTVKTGETGYDALDLKYRSLKSQYQERKSEYDMTVAKFNQESALYEESVKNWNAGNRSSREEFEILETKRRLLENTLSNLKLLETSFNTLVKEVNTTAGELNALARRLNLDVKVYNTVGASRGDTFTGGTYTSDLEGEHIDIFEFENEEKLVRILAHEFGHALGLEHVNDAEAVMYYLNEGDAEELTQSDLDALTLLCGVQ